MFALLPNGVDRVDVIVNDDSTSGDTDMSSDCDSVYGSKLNIAVSVRHIQIRGWMLIQGLLLQNLFPTRKKC